VRQEHRFINRGWGTYFFPKFSEMGGGSLLIKYRRVHQENAPKVIKSLKPSLLGAFQHYSYKILRGVSIF